MRPKLQTSVLFSALLLPLPLSLQGQASVFLSPGTDVEVKISAGTAEWIVGRTVHSMPPGPCLGVVVDREDGFHELLTSFDSLRVTRPADSVVAFARDEVDLDATGCGAEMPPLLRRIANVEHGLARRQVLRNAPDHLPLRERMARYRVPAVVVTVIDSGRIAWTRAYGIHEAGSDRPVDAATLFQVGSISKPVTALGVLRLVEEGRLDLDADVGRYLTSWSLPDNPLVRGRPVTLRHLLAHRGGVNLPSFIGYSRDDSIPSLVQVLSGTPPANTSAVSVVNVPGTVTEYSGGGFTILQMVLEDVTGEPFPRAMDRLVFRRAGMNASSFAQPLSASRETAAAAGHDDDGSAVPGGWYVFPEMAAAGLWTTSADLARLVIAVQDAVAGRDTTLLSRDLTAEMLRELAGGRGLGFEVGGESDRAFFAHDGSNRGFQASLFGFQTRGQGVVIVTNSHNGLSLAYEIRRAVAREYDWPMLQPIQRDVVHLTSEEQQRVVGSYRASRGDPGAELTIRALGDTLMVGSTYWTGERVLHPETSTHLFTLEGDWEMDFRFDDVSGSARSVRFGPVVFERVGR